MAFNANVPNPANTIAADVAAINANWEYVISGDGTGGRVFRLSSLKVEDGTAADSIKCTMTSIWNGTTLAVEDNLADSGDTGNFNLSADGSTITVEAAAFAGNVVACLGTCMYKNSSDSALDVCAVASSNNMVITYKVPGTGAVYDLPTGLTSGEEVTVYIFYVTAA
jgi:hypothetical protein